jgi:hypothetical protein
LVNVLLPLIWDEIQKTGSRAEKSAFRQFYQAVPAAPSRKWSYMLYRLQPQHSQQRLRESAAWEQGSFQIHQDFCIHHESSCAGCPFPQRICTSITQA